MFDFLKKQKPKSELAQSEEVKNYLQEKTGQEPKESLLIHTMPEKFLKLKKEKKGGKTRFILSLFLLFILVLGGLILFSFLKKPIPSLEIKPPSVPQEEEVPKEKPKEVIKSEPEAPPAPEEKPFIKEIEAEVKNSQGVKIGSALLTLSTKALENIDEVGILGFSPPEDPVSKDLKQFQVIGGIYLLSPTEASLNEEVTLTLSYSEDQVKDWTEEKKATLKIAYWLDDNWNILEESLSKPETNSVVTPLNTFTGGNYSIVQADINQEIPPKEPPKVPSEIPQILPSSQDLDNDKLTDLEEELYSTEKEKPDTDEDGYLDGEEILNLYSPLAPKISLADSPLVNTYTSPLFGYSILYPSSWLARAIDSSHRELMFTSKTGEFIEVIIQDNPNGLSILDWYKGQFPDIAQEEIETFSISEKEAIRTRDGLNIYFTSEELLYTITYNPGLKEELNFRTTFEMMVRSFRLAE